MRQWVNCVAGGKWARTCFVINLVDAGKKNLMKIGAATGAAVKARHEQDAEEMIQKIATALDYEVTKNVLAMRRKGVRQKLLIVTLLKKHTSKSNEWIANRLEMEHPAYMRKVTILYRTSKEGVNRIAAYEQPPFSRLRSER